MTDQNLVTAFSTLGLLVLFVLWYGPVRSFLLGAYRQRLFEIRNRWFLYAAEENISFQHSVYEEINGIINGHIAIAHRMTILNFVVMRWWNRDINKYAVQYHQYVLELTQSLPEFEQQTTVKGVLDDVYFVSALYLLLSSPIIWLPSIVAVIYQLVKAGRHVVLQKCGGAYDRWFSPIVSKLSTTEAVGFSL